MRRMSSLVLVGACLMAVAAVNDPAHSAAAPPTAVDVKAVQPPTGDYVVSLAADSLNFEAMRITLDRAPQITAASRHVLPSDIARSSPAVSVRAHVPSIGGNLNSNYAMASADRMRLNRSSASRSAPIPMNGDHLNRLNHAIPTATAPLRLRV